jgi:predicted transcriptional regulator of viral defense system
VDVLLGGRTQYYVGFLSALVSHRLTDLHTSAVYVAVPGNGTIKRAPQLPDRKLHLVHLQPSRWPSADADERERVRAVRDSKEFWWRSSLERTLVDALTRPELSGGIETVVSAWSRARLERRADWIEVARIAKRLGPSTERRVAFLLGALGLPESSAWFQNLVGRSSNVLFDRSRSVDRLESIPRDPRTGVLLNLPVDRLQGWIAGMEIG